MMTGRVYRREGKGNTYVWFSPLGARNHAAAQKMAVTTRPMKGAQLCLLALCHLGFWGRTHPFAIVPVLYVWIGEEASGGGAEAMRRCGSLLGA